jgi:DNA-binding Lrp family transcriptional regulator
MVSTAEREQQLISWRRDKVLELLAQGHISQKEISQKLGVSEPTVSRDIAFLTRQSKENLKFYVEQRIPLEIEKCYTGLNIVLSKAFDITDQENVKISEKIAALHVILTTYDKISEVLLGQPIVKEVVDKFKIKRKQLEEAANEIQREREKDRERKRVGLTAEEYEAAEMETEDRSGVISFR